VFTPKLRKLSYAWLLVQGLFAAVAPKRNLDLNVRLWGFPFENAGELEPSDWYVRTVRAAGVGMLAAGGVGLLLEDRAESTAAESDEEVEVDDEPETVSVDG
jgi:hypothetical protein